MSKPNQIEELPGSLSRYATALEELKKLLLANEADNEGLNCSVYCYDCCGLRIAEIGYAQNREDGGISGSAIMRSDPGSGLVILAAEDFLLTFGKQPYRPEGWESDIDDHADSEWKLGQALKMEVK